MANEFKVKKGLIIDGSGTVVDVQGTAGQLFSVTDSLTGDLFSVSDVSGVPILNINSSGTVELDGTLNVNSSSTLIIDGTVDSNIVMPTAGDQIRIGTFTDGSSNSGEYANDDIVIGDGGSITIFPHRRGDYGLNETGNTSTTFRSKLNIWSDDQDHVTFGGNHTKIRTAWEHFHLWINNDSADAGLFRLYNKSSEVEFARLAGEGSSFVLENFRVKQTADTNFNSGLTVERSANTQKVHIGMDGGAVNFNSPDGLSYKFRNNGTETFTLNGSGYGIISNRLQVGKAGGASNSGRLDLFGRYSGDKPRIFFKTDHPSNSTQWDMAQIYAADGGNYNGQLYFQVASGNGSEGNGASLATALFIDDTKDATFYGNITNSGTVTSNGTGTSKFGGDVRLESGTSGTTAKIIFKTTDNTDTSKYIRTSSYWNEYGAHQNEGHKFTDSVNDFVLLQLNAGNSTSGNGANSATFGGSVLAIAGSTPYIKGTGSGAMRIKHTSGETMYLRPDETGNLSIFEGANSQTVWMMTVAPGGNNTQNHSAKLAFQTRSKQSDGQNNSKTAYIKHTTYDIGNNYGNLEFSGTNKTTFSDMDVVITDNKALMLGTGGDAFIKHTGSHFNIYNDTGAINFIQRVDDGNIVFTCDDGNGGTFDYFSVDGGSTTYANGATTAAYTKWPDKSRIALGTGKDLQLYHDGSNSYINDEGTGNLLFQSGGSTRFSISGDVHVIGTTDFAIPAGRKFYLDGQSNTYITESSDGVIDFYGDAVHLVSMKQNGTQSEVVVNEASGDVDFRVESNNDTHAFFVEAEGTGKVGIGTGTPSAKFEIQGSVGQLFSVTDSLTGDLLSVADVSGIPILNVNSSGAVEVDGTFKVEETSTFKGDVEIHNEGNDTTGKLTISGNNNTGTPGVKTSGTIEHRGEHLKTVITHNGSDVITIGTGTDTAFAGMVTTSSRFNASTQALHFPNYTGSYGWQIGSDSTAVGMYIYSENGVYAMKLTQTGDVAFQGSITSGGHLYLAQYIYHNGDTNTNINFESSQITIATSGGSHIQINNDENIYFRTNGTNRFKMDTTGTFIATNDIVAFGSVSDKSYKENIKPITGALELVDKLKGVTFDWKEDTDTNKMVGIKEDIGFIAQDVQEVLPTLVRENDNGKLSLRDKGIVPVLVEAIKELKQEIEQLKKQINNG